MDFWIADDPRAPGYVPDALAWSSEREVFNDAVVHLATLRIRFPGSAWPEQPMAQ
ncbi:MAG: hypothetical protein AAF662_12035 [Pseudomonadota bacterium]